MSFPSTNVDAVIVFVFLVVAAVIGFLRQRELRILAFRNRCGSNSNRAVHQHGSSRNAEAKPADRESRVNVLKLNEFCAGARERFTAEWQTAQSRFLDSQEGAVTEADNLIDALRESPGYPKDSVEQRAADISVTYRRVMEDYRAVYDITVRPSQDASSAEELRAVMIQYRAIFDKLAQPK
ncbi:MAG: hypothetical protein WAK26_12900 [Terracidiphilus sp.]